MTPERIHISRELRRGRAASRGLYRLGDCTEALEALRAEYAGRIKLIYMDPPYLTGDKFYMRVRVGEQGWQKGRNVLPVLSFSDTRDREKYLSGMRRVLTLCRELLSEDGMIFLHIDFRLHPHLRLLMDDLFGEDNFLNEIIWAYQTGGRSLRHFSRKHDVILFYRKTEHYDFNIDAVKAPPAAPRTNHMRRHMDPDGRVYRSMRVNGRTYTYYDDEPVAPTDVWQDVSHLQQRDPERTGYDAQKPLALLERIVKCGSREGEWVLDPFAGSGTTLEAARRNGRNFIGIDNCPLTLNIARRRLKGADYSIALNDVPWTGEVPECAASVHPGVGFYHVVLEDFRTDIPGMPEDGAPLDAVDNWSVGYMRPEGYRVMAEFARSKKAPELARELAVPVYAGELALCVGEVTGRCSYYALEPEH